MNDVSATQLLMSAFSTLQAPAKCSKLCTAWLTGHAEQALQPCCSTQPLVAVLCVMCSGLQLLGFKLGVFHVELKATSRGPRLIEINARMGGGPVR